MRNAMLSLALVLLAGSVVDGQKQKESLKGITAFHVSVIVDTKPEIDLSEATLQVAAELKLRQNGIRIAEKDETAPAVLTSIQGMESDVVKRMFVYRIETSVLQMVKPVVGGDPLSRFVATIWRTSSFGTIGMSNVTDLRTTFNDQLDAFLNDYLAANPKK